MKPNVYQSGNRVKLSVKFENDEGVLTDPAIVKLIIYNYKYEIIDQHTIGDANRLNAGEYFYDYVTDKSKNETIFYEWYGEIDGTPTLCRNSFMTKFI
jgi:hypothetical protein